MYYFTNASLPHLTYDTDKFPTIEQFLDTCEVGIDMEDFKILKSALIDDLDRRETGSNILDRWYDWERDLRNELVQLRAKQKKLDPEKYIKESPDLLTGEHVAREAFEHESPLHGEDVLNWARWSFLDEIELGHYFDFEKLIIYYLKLQVLWRKQSFNKEKGNNKLNEIIEKISTIDFPQSESQH